MCSSLPRWVLLAALVLPFGACADSDPDPAAVLPEAGTPVADGEVAVPAGSGASAPRLALDADGVPVLSWTQPDANGHALLVARWTGTGWSVPDTADTGPDRFVNWADTPGAVPLADGRMLAHVLTRGSSAHAYDAQLRFLADSTWGEAGLLNTDGIAAEHGFVSAVPLADGGAGVVWLDGRNQAAGSGHHAGNMTLRYAEFASDGGRRGETELDARTCDCCPTALVATPSGMVAAYRDRSAGEIRDVAVVRLVDGAWTKPTIPHADGWQIDGCPVNGPALAARGERVAMAWFAAPDSALVRLSVSEDGGATWDEPIRLDDGAPIGRVGVAILDDGRVATTWLERVGDMAEVRLHVSGMATSQPVATVASGRASGIPRVLAWGDRALVAWTDPGAGSIRTALLSP